MGLGTSARRVLDRCIQRQDVKAVEKAAFVVATSKDVGLAIKDGSRVPCRGEFRGEEWLARSMLSRGNLFQSIPIKSSHLREGSQKLNVRTAATPCHRGRGGRHH